MPPPLKKWLTCHQERGIIVHGVNCVFVKTPWLAALVLLFLCPSGRERDGYPINGEEVHFAKWFSRCVDFCKAVTSRPGVPPRRSHTSRGKK